jgi:hypothetical protein
LWGLPVNKYIKSYAGKKSFGITLRAKLEFPVINFFGVEMAVYTEINKLQSFTGIEFYLNLGNIGD